MLDIDHVKNAELIAVQEEKEQSCKFKMRDTDHVKTAELIVVQEEKDQSCKEVILYKEKC